MLKVALHRLATVLLYFKIVNSHNIPYIPCPDIFQYMSSGNNIFGLVTLNQLPLANTVVDVEFMQRKPITSNYFGRLSLNQDLLTTEENLERGKPISYRVDFPNSKIFPKLTGIKVNGNIICIGQGFGPPSSTFRLQHTFYPARPIAFNYSSSFNIDLMRNNDEDGFVFTVITPHPNGPERNRETTQGIDNNNGEFHEQWKITPAKEIPYIPNNRSPQFIPNNRPEGNTPVNYPVQNNPVNYPDPVNRPQYNNQNNYPSANVPVNPPVNYPVESTPPDQSAVVGCGREGITPFVVGGEEFPRGKFPWLAAIFTRTYSDFEFKCGGSLISPRTVITAAHCFPSQSFPANSILIYLGRHNLHSPEEGSIQRNVASLRVHPSFNFIAFSDADIALLHMSSAVGFNQYIRPICLWSQPTELRFIESRNGLIAGWGADNNGHEVTSEPKMIKTRIVSDYECQRTSESFRTMTSARSICAGNRDNTGPCIGDSGSGLMLNIFGEWTLRGIVSFGNKKDNTCDLSQFVVYCDVAQHMPWVRENM